MQLRKNPSVEKKSQEDKPNSTVNTLAALLSSTVGLLVFHPADTLVKRLQNKNTKVDPGKVDSLKKATLSSFYKGFLSASALSATHKVIKYAGEPVVKELLHQHAPQKSPVMEHAISGFLIGGFEAVVLAPFNAVKTKKQLLSTLSYLELWRADTQRFQAAPITFIRNSSGTATFFATDSFLRHQVFHVSDHDTLSFKQKMITSALCPTLGEFVAHPADTIKTHIQGSTTSPGTAAVFSNIMKTSGVRGLYQGLGTRLVVTLPRGGVSYLLFQCARDQIQKTVKKDAEQAVHLAAPKK